MNVTIIIIILIIIITIENQRWDNGDCQRAQTFADKYACCHLANTKHSIQLLHTYKPNTDPETECHPNLSA